MLDDLFDSKILLNINRSKVFELLGPPFFMNETTFKYHIREKYDGYDIDPVYNSYLEVHFDTNNVVSNYKLIQN